MRPGKTTLIHFGSQVVISVAGFVATFAVIRLLGPAALGIYAPAVALVFWLHVPAMAISDAVKKRLSENGDSGHFASGILLNGTFALIVALIVLGAGEYVRTFVGEPVVSLVAILFVGNVFVITIIGALNGRKRVATAGGLRAIERLVRTTGQVGLIVTGYGVTGLFLGHIGSLAVAVAVGIVLLGTQVGRPTVGCVQSLLRYSRYSWLGTLRSRTFAWMDTIVLAAFVGLGTAGPAVTRDLIGTYEVAWNLASLLALVGISVQSTLFPELSELGADEDYDRIHHLLNEGFVFTGVFTIPGLFGAAVIGNRVLKIYDPALQKGIGVLFVLIIARLLASFGMQLVSAINALDRPDVTFRINGVFIAVNLTLNVLLIWQFGWIGAAVATAISAAVLLGLGYRSLTALIGKPGLPLKEIVHEVTAAVGMAVIVFLGRIVAPQNHYATVALVGIGAAVYLALLLVLSDRIRDKAIGLARTATG